MERGRSEVLNVCRKVGGARGGGGCWWRVTTINQGERVNSNSGHFCDNVISEYRGPVVFTIL